MNLNRKKTFFLNPRAPFHFDGTFHKPSHFPNNLSMNDWQPSNYWQSLRVGKNIYGLKIVDAGSAAHPKLKVTVYSTNRFTREDTEGLKREIRWRFDLNADLKSFNRMARQDRIFYPVFKKWVGMRSSSQYTLYELLMISIVLQNATVRRSQQMLDVLLLNFGTEIAFDGKMFWSIWTPQKMTRVTEQMLRDLKIGYRAKFIKRLSQDFVENKVNEMELQRMDQENAQKELVKLYGVGPETARILLFECLHHYGVFEHIAPWQQKIYSKLFYNRKMVSSRKIRNDIQNQYKEFSMLAVHYIWEDIFWRRKVEQIPWLENEIRI